MPGQIPITPEWLRRTYLKGVVTTENGREFPRDLYVHSIRAAHAYLEGQVGIVIGNAPQIERVDLEDWRSREYQMIRVRKQPVLASAPLSIAYKLGTQTVFNVPDGWQLRVVPESATIELVPFNYSVPALPVDPAGHWLGVYATGAAGRFPGWYEVTYTAGFELGDIALHHAALTDLTETYEGLPYATGTLPAYGHRLDVRGTPTIHKAADTANDILVHGGQAVYAGLDLAEAIVQANALRAAYEAHRVSVVAHTAADTVNAVAAPAATNLATLTTLINDLLVKFQRHMATAGTVHGQADTQRPITAGSVRNDYLDLPYDIRHALGTMASMGVLNPAGDLIAGAGIANYAVSVDGLSQSIGTTSSATNAGYGSRIIQYAKDLKTLIPTIKSRYRDFSLG